jgi:hypothetical protein
MKHIIPFILILTVLSGCTTKPAVVESDELDTAMQRLLQNKNSLENFIQHSSDYPEFAKEVGAFCSRDEKQEIIEPFIEFTQYLLDTARQIVDATEALIRIQNLAMRGKIFIDTSDLLSVYQIYNSAYDEFVWNQAGDWNGVFDFAWHEYLENFYEVVNRLLQSSPSP